MADIHDVGVGDRVRVQRTGLIGEVQAINAIIAEAEVAFRGGATQWVAAEQIILLRDRSPGLSVGRSAAYVSRDDTDGLSGVEVPDTQLQVKQKRKGRVQEAQVEEPTPKRRRGSVLCPICGQVYELAEDVCTHQAALPYLTFKSGDIVSLVLHPAIRATVVSITSDHRYMTVQYRSGRVTGMQRTTLTELWTLVG